MSEINWETREGAEQYEKNSDHQFLKGQMLVKMMQISTGNQVLDLGCGTGRLAEHICHIIGPNGSVTGVDPSSERLMIAQKRCTHLSYQNAHFFSGQAEKLDNIADNTYDRVLFCSSFHWVDDKSTALLEAFRVLKPGGTIGMTTLNRNGGLMRHEIINSVLSDYGLPELKKDHFGGLKRVTKDELQDLLTNSGFTRISIEVKMIPHHHVGGRYLNESGPGSLPDIIKDLDTIDQQKIREECVRMIQKYAAENPSGSGPLTLFGIAKKENG